MIIWIFNSTKEAKLFIDSKWIVINVSDRIIVGWSEQTTYEWDGNFWKNINWIYIKWKDWEDWLPWKKWKDAEEVNLKLLYNEIYEKLRSDKWFIAKCKWEKWDSIKWDPGETIIPNIKEIVEILLKKLIDNKEFIEKIKPEDWKPGKDWYTPIKWKDYFDWEPGKTPKKWVDYDDWIDWEDWHKLVFIEDPNNVNLKPNEFWIDINKNIYIIRNNSILKL